MVHVKTGSSAVKQLRATSKELIFYVTANEKRDDLIIPFHNPQVGYITTPENVVSNFIGNFAGKV
jgi:hypothetical protein